MMMMLLLLLFVKSLLTTSHIIGPSDPVSEGQTTSWYCGCTEVCVCTPGCAGSAAVILATSLCSPPPSSHQPVNTSSTQAKTSHTRLSLPFANRLQKVCKLTNAERVFLPFIALPPSVMIKIFVISSDCSSRYSKWQGRLKYCEALCYDRCVKSQPINAIF